LEAEKNNHEGKETMNIDPLAQRAPYEVSPRQYSVSHQMATTAFELPNFRVMQTLGVVRGDRCAFAEYLCNHRRIVPADRRWQYHYLDKDV
jgi:hypothetical protein